MMIKTYAKMRYKEFAEDDKCSTLASSCFDFGSGGGESIVVIYEDNRDRPLQPKSDGGVAKTLNAIKCDSDHVPCVIYESMDMQCGDDNKMGRKLHLERQVPDN